MNQSSGLAWILHYRPYKETSVIADLLTLEGKVSVVISGVKRYNKKKRCIDRIVEPFTQLNAIWRGRSELKTMVYAETEKIIRLQGRRLLSGLYVNELLLRVLYPLSPVDGIWSLYGWLLNKLTTDFPLEPLLRLFEKKLLCLLGYGLPLQIDIVTQQPIKAQKMYGYNGNGFYEIDNYYDVLVIPGWLLIDYDRDIIRSCMLPILKQLNRQAIAPLLKYKPLRSRELFY